MRDSTMSIGTCVTTAVSTGSGDDSSTPQFGKGEVTEQLMLRSIRKADSFFRYRYPDEGLESLASSMDLFDRESNF